MGVTMQGWVLIKFAGVVCTGVDPWQLNGEREKRAESRVARSF